MPGSLNDAEIVGARVRRFRQRRGLTQQVAADLAGISQPYWSQIERGERIMDRRSTAGKIAHALRVDVADLIDQWWPDEDPVHAGASARMSEVRATLMDSDIFAGADAPVLPVDQLAAEHAQLYEDTIACRLAPAADRLAHLFPQTHSALTGPERDRALRLLVGVCQRGYLITRRLGFYDLAYLMAQRGVEAARETNDRVLLAAAEYDLLSGRMHGGGYRLAQLQAVAVADDLRRNFSDDGQDIEVAGMLNLAAAMCATVNGANDDAAAHLAEAETLADRTGDRTGFGFFFGPGNVGLWRQALAIEAGEPDQALRIGQHVLVHRVPSILRQSNYHADRARALHLIGDHTNALRAVSEAERLAPLWAPRDQGLRDIVAAAYLERRKGVGGELERLAQRFGVAENLP